MARTAGKKQAPAKIEEDDDTEGWEDAVVDTEGKGAEADLRLRDWRDVERYREMKELRSLVDDDYGLEEIFHVPLRPRAQPGAARAGVGAAKAATTKVAPPAKTAAPKNGAVKPVPAKAIKAPPKHAAPPAAKRTPAPSKKTLPGSARARGAGLKAKAKRR